MAGRSHGIVGYEELIALGLSSKEIRRRVRGGWMTELFLGAYLVGHHNVTRRTYWKAATVSCGRDSVISHRAAAQMTHLIALIPGPPHVTIPERRTLHRPGIVIHRSRDLPPSQVTTRFGIRVTTPERTLLDFASEASPYELRDAVRAARRKDILDVPLSAEMCRKARGRRGVGRLADLLAEDHGPIADTRSPLEDLFLPICADFGIRYPKASAPVLDFEVDCLWLPERLVVELDGWEFHKSREAFEADRRRDIRLGLAGYPVQRLTNERLTQDRAAVARDVSAMLARLRSAAA